MKWISNAALANALLEEKKNEAALANALSRNQIEYFRGAMLINSCRIMKIIHMILY